MKKILVVLGSFLVFLWIAQTAYSEDAYQVVLKSYNLDEGKDSKTEMTMELINKSGKKRVREITHWQLERGEEDKSLMKFRKPASVKGSGFLVWEHKIKDDDQWLYLPAFKRIRRISATEKHKSFMGTDFSYNDMTMPHPKDSEHKLLGEENVDGFDCYKIESIHKTYTGDPAYKDKKKYQYSKSDSWIRKDNYMAVKSIMFDKKGREYKQFSAREIKKVDGIWTAHILEMKNVKDKHRTVLTITSIRYNTGIRDNFFTQRQLKKPR